MNEVSLRKHLEDPQILQVKQGFSPWYPASVVRGKLNKLNQEGTYLHRNGVVEGPYTVAKAYELLKAQTDESIQVKTTMKGDWVSREHWVATIERLRDR